MYNQLKLWNNLSRFSQCNKKKLHVWTKEFVKFSSEVRDGLSQSAPIVALESTVITHGLPFPDNLSTASKMEEVVRNNKAIPATIGIIDGIIHIGMSKNELEILASKNRTLTKISRRDLPYVMSKKMSGGTTVSATMILAHKAGVPIFATGGIGGVHREGENTMDVSADLYELARTPLTVVSAGVKSILDIDRTLEYLETLGVCVASFGPSKDFPAFFTPKSGFFAACHVSNPKEAAELIDSRDKLELDSGLLLAVPISEEFYEDGLETESVIEEALNDAKANGVKGKDVTPFVLNRVRELSDGASLRANIGLLMNNAKVASQIAVNLNNLKNRSGGTGSSRVLQNSCKSIDKKSCFGRPVVVGGSVLDIHVKALEDVKMDGRTLAGQVGSTAGGVGRNLADGMSRLELNPFFISAVGVQEHSQALLSKMRHMDISGIKLVPDSRTGVCIINIDQYGECLYVIGDMDIHDRITRDLVEEHKEVISKAPLLIMDGNIPLETMDYLLKMCGENNVPIWFEPTDLSKAHRPFLSSTLWKSALSYATPNMNELRIMYNTIFDKNVPLSSGVREHLNVTLEEALELGKPLLDGSFHTLVVTLGAHGVLVISNLQSTSFLVGKLTSQKGELRATYYPSLKTNSIVSVSGAGDCFASGMIGGILRGLPRDFCVQVGQRAAILSLASHLTVPETISPQSVFFPEDFNKESLIIC
ncbi:uncharacterized protein [Parasteatoda tepidariorum]|uniref:uncharacterized protein isoform X1 n=1 Tax=Parasteatoda tepidariorum TaxID=114398 RepID=UPI001C7201D9|nr:pseudouridine-metabolizing bifunctional protein C1861.05 [Parasteatoda tepidariorum]XP_015909349.2 pseudouridine-metabolizing bifunctional protein C1861.05 [Parasteatoda tepidariorum]XP_015909351.2 pseudouridine-metabolizing bifunctional protein C1861.05 [Parasteatoda tepidariorum]XP_015909352.2 pseudouridine-metabolizing bifunctional protein C1861.05 [Parasteatoda tepidariorum]